MRRLYSLKAVAGILEFLMRPGPFGWVPADARHRYRFTEPVWGGGEQ